MEEERGDHQIPVPLSTTYGGVGHLIHHHHNHNHDPSSAAASMPLPLPSNNNGPLQEDHVPFKRAAAVRYRECLKNHAASMGGSATDGCGEFMPSGAEGTLEALTCSACNCHRNFHRKETEGHPSPCDCFHRVLPHHHAHRKQLLLGGYPLPSRALPYSNGGGGGSIPSESEEDGGGGAAAAMQSHQMMVKKRFRTKFTSEQKEKMLSFAEKVGWKIQKQEENVVQQFCQEVGVKRRVLKVWMHNNKHSLAKKSSSMNNMNNMNMNMNMNMNSNNSVPSMMQMSPQNHVQNNNQV